MITIYITNIHEGTGLAGNPNGEIEPMLKTDYYSDDKYISTDHKLRDNEHLTLILYQSELFKNLTHVFLSWMINFITTTSHTTSL